MIVKLFFQMAYNCFNSSGCYDCDKLNTSVEETTEIIISIRYDKSFPSKKCLSQKVLLSTGLVLFNIGIL